MNKYKEILEHGCGDHGCYFKKPVGMGTNGGCRCLQDIVNTRNTIQALPILVQLLSDQEEEIKKLKHTLGFFG